MTEFTATAHLDVVLDDRSVRDARDQLEDELGGLPAGVQADVQRSNPELAARDRARSRQLLSENIDLDRRRNELLERLLEQQEQSGDLRNRLLKSGFSSLGAATGLLGAGVLGVGLGLASLAEAIPDVPNRSPSRPPRAPPGSGGPGSDGTVLPGPSDAPAPAPTQSPTDRPSSPSGDGGLGLPDIDPVAGLIGATGVGAGLSALRGLGSSGSSTTSGLPVALPAVLAGREFQRGRQDPDEKTVLERLFGEFGGGGATGPGGVQTASLVPLGAATPSDQTQNRAQENRESSDVTVNVDVTADGVSRRDLRQAMDRAVEDALEEFERRFSGGGGGRGPRVR